MRNFDETTSVKPWWNHGGGAFRGTFWQPNTDLPRKPETPRNLEKLGGTWWNPGGTLPGPWWNLGGTFRGTFWQPSTDLPQRTSQGESESNPAAKPLLWLKTPKLLLLGKNDSLSFKWYFIPDNYHQMLKRMRHCARLSLLQKGCNRRTTKFHRGLMMRTHES